MTDPGPSSAASPAAGHQRGLGLIFVASGALYCLQTTAVVAHVMGLWRFFRFDPGLEIERGLVYRMYVVHFWCYVLAVSLYLASSRARGGRITLQDLVDAFGSLLGFVAVFLAVSLALARRGAHPLWAFAPGFFITAYGGALILRRPPLDVSRLTRQVRA